MNRPRGPNLAVDHDHVVCMIIVILLTARHGCIGPVFQMLIRRIAVKRISLIVAAAAAISMAGVATGFAAELPTFEANGLPISAVQVAVLGAAHVQEQSPVATTALSPYQLRVLTPRSRRTAAAVAPGRIEDGTAN